MHQLWCGHRPLKAMVSNSLPYQLWQQYGASPHPWQMEQQTWHMIQIILEYLQQILLTLWDILISQPQQIQNNMLNQVNETLFNCLLFIVFVHARAANNGRSTDNVRFDRGLDRSNSGPAGHFDRSFLDTNTLFSIQLSLNAL